MPPPPVDAALSDTLPSGIVSPARRASESSRERFATGPHRRISGVAYLDHYKLEDELGRGGMAVVYRAKDTTLQRDVALKVLHEHIASRQEYRERFEREARAVARLKHDNIMSVFGFSSPSAPVGYLVAELIDGETLRDFVDRRGFGLPEVAGMVCLRLADALQHAHEQGVIHRDFKPENVMINREGVPKLMDFGLARLLDHQTMTMTGAVLGSPAHMSPELIEGKPVDARVDIFAFGTTLYYASTGRLPFEGNNPAVLLNAILVGSYPDPVMITPRIGARLSRIIARCLETNPDDRYQTADALRTDLRGWLSELGFDDIDDELQKYFADVDGRERALEAHLVVALERQASAAMEERRMGAALAYCDQLLVYEPDNATALRILGRAKSQRRARRALVVAALLAAVVAMVWWQPWQGPPIEVGVATDAASERVGAAAADAQRHANQAALAAEDAVVRDVRIRSAIDEAQVFVARAHQEFQAHDAAVAVRERAGAVHHEIVRYYARRIAASAPPRPTAAELEALVRFGEGTAEEGSGDQPPEPPSPPMRHVRFNVFPPTAMVRVNGEDIGRAAELNRAGVSLPVGTHRVEINVPNSQRARLTQRFEVRAVGINRAAFRVPWAPGFVEVDARRPGRVIVDGRAYATGERIEIPIEGDATEREVELQLFPPDGGGAPTVTRVTVRTEQTVAVSAPF